MQSLVSDDAVYTPPVWGIESDRQIILENQEIWATENGHSATTWVNKLPDTHGPEFAESDRRQFDHR